MATITMTSTSSANTLTSSSNNESNETSSNRSSSKRSYSNNKTIFLNASAMFQSPRHQRQQIATRVMNQTTHPLSWTLLTWLYCICLIILTSPFIALAYCNELLPEATATAPISTPHAAAVGPPPGVEYSRRYARSAIYANDYSSLSSAAAVAATTTTNKVADKNNHESHLAAFGLRTKYKPQHFYNKPGGDSSAVNAATELVPGSKATRSDLTSFDLVSGAREDICKDHCTCAKVKNAFTTISCDFQENRKLSEVFGANFKVPEDATSIAIKLASNTNFRLERGFFNNNKVNSLSIDGTYNEREQVEITTEAFRGNYGPYPEIYMMNVFSVVVRAKAFSGNCKFSVRNSNDLILFPDAFQNASINGLFIGINDLRIEEKAFNSAQAKLRIESSHIDNIYRFEASLREIRFVNCSIGTINGGTFDVITINSIVFEACRIDVIKARAITEKLYSEHVSITGAVIGTIESEAIYGSGIAELILTKNRIDSIHENAIHVTAINATITSNHVKHLGNNWLRVKDWSNIVVSRNQFGVFGRMLLEDTKLPVTCRFESNSLTQPLPGSLNVTNRYCILREISVNIPCKCSLNWLHELSARDLRSEVYCTIDDKLSFCFNATTFNTLKYLNEVCDDTKTTLDCVKNMNLKKINGLFFTPEELERRDQRIPKLIFIVAGGVTLIILAVTAVITAVRCCRRSSKDGGSGQQSHNAAVQQRGEHLHEFSNADRHVIQQTLLIMQKKYPDIHKPVNGRIQDLLQNNLSDKKCVKIVSNIVDLLNKIEQPGDDFVALNRALTQHLQPQLPTAPPSDPIYAEPGLNDGFYTTSAIMPATQGSLQSVSAGGAVTCLPEHIYAEPHCAQQPLLRNEYASPADGNMESMDLYTEPINERDFNVSTPQINTTAMPRLPQYATPMRNQKLPSIPTTTKATSQKLPNVLYQSQHQSSPSSATSLLMNSPSTCNPSLRPLTNVQRIAQDLQNMPKFYMNSTTPNSTRRNLHLLAPPMYSAPDSGNPKTHFSRAAEARLATPEIDECELDMRGAAALPPDSGSNHSGGSDETVKIDDVIQYADA